VVFENDEIKNKQRRFVMTLVRLYPRHPWLDFPNEVFRHLDSWGDEKTATVFAQWSPAVDIADQEKEYQVSVELPGVKKDDIKINFRDNVLTISGEKKTAQDDDRKNFQRSERVWGTFQRCFRLPEQVDSEKISAEFKNGILNVAIPKVPEILPKQIEIKVK